MNVSMKSKRVATLSGILLAFVPFLSAQQPDGSITRKVDVVVRRVTAVITDEKGQPLTVNPLPSDFELLEDGQRCEIVGMDRVAEGSVSKNARPSSVPAGDSSTSLPSRSSGKGRRQVLYIDTRFERHTSVKEAAQAFAQQVEPLVALGTVEIVVADPEPKLFLPPTRDAGTLRTALDGLGKHVVGRDRVMGIRRDTLDSSNSDASIRATRGSHASSNFPITGSARGRGAISEETAVIRGGLARLSRWATSSPVPTEGILYLASDGFDTDLTSFYSDVASDPVRNEVLTPLFSEIRGVEQALLAGGWTTVPVAMGSAVGSGFTSGAEFTGAGHVLGLASSNSISFADHPLDPLRAFAEATGGELLVSGDQLKGALSRFSNAFEVSFQVARVPDGRLHKLVLKSRRRGSVVRTVRAIPVGTIETASASRALDLLDAGAVAGGALPVKLSLSTPEDRGKGRLGASLEVRVLIRDIRPLLARLGEGRMRVSVAFEIPGEAPFVTHDEKILGKDLKEGWLLELPMVWPKGAQKIAVVAEELASGSSGTATLELRPH